jgi:hypothetical protein
VALPEHPGQHRLLHIHRNVPGVLSAINQVLSEQQVNVAGQYLQTNPDIGYVVIDIESDYSGPCSRRCGQCRRPSGRGCCSDPGRTRANGGPGAGEELAGQDLEPEREQLVPRRLPRNTSVHSGTTNPMALLV